MCVCVCVITLPSNESRLILWLTSVDSPFHDFRLKEQLVQESSMKGLYVCTSDEPVCWLTYSTQMCPVFVNQGFIYYSMTKPRSDKICARCVKFGLNVVTFLWRRARLQTWCLGTLWANRKRVYCIYLDLRSEDTNHMAVQTEMRIICFTFSLNFSIFCHTRGISLSGGLWFRVYCRIVIKFAKIFTMPWGWILMFWSFSDSLSFASRKSKFPVPTLQLTTSVWQDTSETHLINVCIPYSYNCAYLHVKY